MTGREMTAHPGAPDGVTAPPGRCPKCVGPRAETSVACHACGLAFRNFCLDDHLPPPFLVVAWRELLAGWAEPKAHRAFLALALSRGELVAAARLYRIRSAQHPDDALASRGLQEIVRVALIPTESPGRGAVQVARRPPTWRAVWWIVAFGASALLGAPLFSRLFH